MDSKKLLPLLLIPFLTACGQPGPLYMPAKQIPVPVKPAPAVKPEPAKDK